MPDGSLPIRKTRLNHSFVTLTGLVDAKDLVDEESIDKTHKRAMFLVREFARLVATALDKRNTSVLEAYENAAQAAVMARTAKEIDSDVSRLSDDLGVDFYEYLSYTGTCCSKKFSCPYRNLNFQRYC